MDLSVLWLIARRELREALRSKWLLLYTAGFTLLAVSLSRGSLASAGYAGLGGFGRTAASLVNALILFVPLLGLSVGAGVLAGDLERGTLHFLLAQPVSRAEIFWGKVLGALLAVSAALCAGFGLAALALASGGGASASAFLGLLAYTVLLMLVSLGLGFLISSLTRKNSTAMGAALLLWLSLIFLADLALVGAVLTMRPTPASLLALLLVNPLQVYKLGAVHALQPSLDAFGPVGQYAVYRYGDQLSVMLPALLTIWSTASFALAYQNFKRRTKG